MILDLDHQKKMNKRKSAYHSTMNKKLKREST